MKSIYDFDQPLTEDERLGSLLSSLADGTATEDAKLYARNLAIDRLKLRTWFPPENLYPVCCLILEGLGWKCRTKSATGRVYARTTEGDWFRKGQAVTVTIRDSAGAVVVNHLHNEGGGAGLPFSFSKGPTDCPGQIIRFVRTFR